MKQYLMHKDVIVAEVDSFRRLQKVIEPTEMPVGTYSEKLVKYQ